MAPQKENIGLSDSVADLQDVISMRPYIDSSLDPEVQAAQLALEILQIRKSLMIDDADPVGLQVLLEHYADYIVANVRQ